MDEDIMIAKKEEYLYVINGVIPEAMPPVAYRRTGRPELANRKIIKCPYCSETLTHVDRHTQVQLYRLPKGKQKKTIPGLQLRQCDVCKNEIGVVMI